MLTRPTILFALILALFALPSAAHAQRQWLTGDPTPLRYEIAVTPDAEAGSFTGEARIIVENVAALSSITMNALDLDITSARIDNARAVFALDPEAQTLTLTPRRPLAPGRHTIRIVYRGKIFDDAYGLFRVSYEADGQTKRALATQFEVGDARRLAPMWDQPNHRAVFSMTVTAPADQMVISNMPAEQVMRVAGGRLRTRFSDTPSMSSYLLFLAMGDFERVTRDVDGVELGVVMRRGESARAGLALDAGEQSLRYFTEYFGVRYPLPKLDMIAVPGAGGFAAMENWGAILYFDQYLLLDEQSSEAERQNVFGIVAHEIAHQWFGNLVTMEWWDDLWLNEGFASWMAAKATEAIHPDWSPWLAQLTDGTATAMALDARVGTHPVVQTVNTIDEANLAFDSITYEKGLAVIRMIEAYVGEDNFRRGVRDYINAHAHGNARTEDLWTAIQAASGEPVLAIAHSFTGQPGFPVLSASAVCDRRQGALLTLNQRRFAMDETSRTGETWEIPVVARTLSGAPRRAVLEASGSIALSDCSPYIVNAGQSGLYRVLYDRVNFSELVARFGRLDKADQLGLLLDYWAFGRSGDAPFTNYLDLVNAIPADADPVIVMDTAASMLAFADYAKGRPSEPSVRAYGRRTLRPFFDRLGWTPHAGELANDARARAQLISALGAMGDEEIIAEASRRVAAAESDASALPGSIRAAALGVQALNATPEEFEAMLAQARAAGDFVEQRRLWLTLAGARDETLARRSLDLVLGEEIPRQIRTQVVASVSGPHPRLAWDFVVANRAAMEALLDPLSRLEYPGEIASAGADAKIADELEAYARNFPEGAMASVASAAATIRLRAQTVSERMPAVEAWIAARGRPPARGRAAR